MDTTEIREIIKQELPRLIRDDPAIHALILRLSRGEFAPVAQTQDRFDRIMAQLERDGEENNRRWEEARKHWEENQRESNQRWEENNRRWEEYRHELNQHREEEKERRKDQTRRWEEDRREFDQAHEEIMALVLKQERTAGGPGRFVRKG